LIEKLKPNTAICSWISNKLLKVLFVSMFIHAYQGKAQVTEFELKAVYIEHFSRFIEWPSADHQEVFIVKVIGNSELRHHLEKIYKNRTIKNKKVVVQYIEDPADIDNCHILFISKDKRRLVDEILQHTRDKSILTIGDTPGYAHNGVIINFLQENNKISFEFNISAVKMTGLDVSFRLLETAKLIKNK
jgi:hypothetical protein